MIKNNYFKRNEKNYKIKYCRFEDVDFSVTLYGTQ